MIEFTKVNAQRVRHISGYEVYPDGKEYIVYKNKDVIYKVSKEYGWDTKLNKGILYIYTSEIYDDNLKKVFLPKDEQNLIISRILKAEAFMTNFKIDLVS